MVTDGKDAQEQAAPPEALVEQVKQALEHLYDFSYLERHPLALGIGYAAERTTETAGQRLRREFIAAIEALSPGPGVPFRAPHARLYNVIHLHYVEGMTVQEVARELSISLRQAYRDLRHGEESIAAVLWARRSALTPQEAEVAQASSVQTEITRLETHPRLTDVRALLEHAQKAVERLALQRAISFHVTVPPKPVTVSTDPVIAQQVLVNAFSHAVQQARSGTLSVALTPDREQASCLWRYISDSSAADEPVINAVAAQLADRLGWTVERKDQPGNVRTLILHMTTHGPAVLVIDDNEGLVELLERYLTGHTCRVVAATSGQEGLQLAQKLVPDAIVLDVMMPGMDGWELLQILRTRPQTANIPAIVCSVFNDPELAYSLGASLFLPKPVSRDSVLTALHQLGVV